MNTHSDDLLTNSQAELAALLDEVSEFPGMVEVAYGQVGVLDRDSLRNRIEDAHYSGDDIGALWVVSDSDNLIPASLRSEHEHTDDSDYMHYRCYVEADKGAGPVVLAVLWVRIDGRS